MAAGAAAGGQAREADVQQASRQVSAAAACLQWLVGLRETFGTNLLVTIFCAHHLLKGFVGGGGSSGLIGNGMEFVYRGYGVSGPDLQVYTSVALLPWSIKAMMGVMSDGFPLFGYRKISYLIIFAVLAQVSYLLLGFLMHGLGGPSSPDEEGPPAASSTPALPLPAVTLGFFLLYAQMSLSDLLVEGKYSEKIKLTPERGPDLVTFVWGGMQVAGFLSTAVAGWLIESAGPAACYLLAAPFAATVAWPAARNYLEERVWEGGRRCKPDPVKWHGEGRVPFLIALATGAAGLFLALVSVFAHGVRLKFIAAVSVGLFNLLLFSVFIRPAIARINAFLFLQNVFHVGTHGASFYFFTDTLQQYPDGPHFSTRFYVTTIGSVAALSGLLGMAFYNRYARNMKYRHIFVVGSLAYMVVNCLSAIVFLRLNVRLHISDSLFMVASSGMQSALGQLTWMPGTVMLAQLCPKGLEATMYALLASSMNLGMAIANYAGAFLLEYLGVNPRGADNEGVQFEYLWVAALVSACGPCVPLLLVNILIPDARQSDRLLDKDDDDSSATAGSLWEQWRGVTRTRRPPHTEYSKVGRVSPQDSPTARAAGTGFSAASPATSFSTTAMGGIPDEAVELAERRVIGKSS